MIKPQVKKKPVAYNQTKKKNYFSRMNVNVVLNSSLSVCVCVCVC